MKSGIQIRLLLLALISFAALLAGCAISDSTTGSRPEQSRTPRATTGPSTPPAPSFTTLRATLTYRSAEGTTLSRSTFACDAAGNWSLRPESGAQEEGSGETLSEVYNARHHRLVETFRNPSGRLVSYVFDDVWPYEEQTAMPGGGGSMMLGEAWVVRAAALEGDPPLAVEDVVADGRPAWRVVFERLPGPLEDVSLTVDQESGLPLAWNVPLQEVGFSDGGYSGSLTDLRLDEPLPPKTFSAEPPAGARVEYLLKAELFCGLDDVASRVGFRPFVPARRAIPHGYRLTDVATDGRTPAEFFGWSEPELQGPDSNQFLRYRRVGFDSFTVQVASTLVPGEPDETVSELKHLTSGIAQQSRRLTAGAFAGRTAHTWFYGNGANLVVVGRRHVAFISGTLTRQQLYEVAEGLRQR